MVVSSTALPEEGGSSSFHAGQTSGRRGSRRLSNLGLGLAETNPGHNDETAQRSISMANDLDEEALDEIRRYESFSTVDWITDSMRERARETRKGTHRNTSSNAHLANGTLNGGFAQMDAWGKGRFEPDDRPPRWWPTENPWGRRLWWFWRFICRAAGAVTDSGVVVMVGLLIGMNMAVISIATEWFSDIKQGRCAAGWWLNKKFCCGEMTDSTGPGGALPPVAVKVSTAAAAAAVNKATATMSNVAQARDHLQAFPAFTAAAQLSSRAIPFVQSATDHLYRRAANDTATNVPLQTTPADVCPDWIPWSTWTLPSFLIYIIFAIALSAACAYLVRVFAPYAAGSGISEIKCILAGFIINGFLGTGTFAIKSLGLPLAISSGLSVGKEGPAVHIACCIGNIVGTWFRSFARSQARMRELLTAASAAGVAVAFGSPIGGVLFSLEEMAYNFPSSTMWRSFLCALAATVALSFMNPFRTGKLVLFQVSYDRDWHYFEIFFYVIIGIFGGLYGAFVIKYNLQVQKFRRENLASHGVSEAVILAAMTAMIGYWNMFLRIDMSESLEILFRECEGGGDYDNLCQSSAQWRMVNSLLLATVLRIALVILSYGCKVPAGIFVPSMAIGATFGRMIGILVKSLQTSYPHASFFSACQPDVPCITPGTYAFLGAAAALAGVTRITVAVVVIMFELTGALTYILPTMLVVMITKGIADWYAKGGIAEQTIKFQGYPFLDKDDHVFNLKVGDVMTKDAVVLYAGGMELFEVEKRLASGVYKGFPIVQDAQDRILLGYIGKTELRYAIGKARHARNSLSSKTMCYFTLNQSEIIPNAPPTPALNTFDDEEELAAAKARRRTPRENETLLSADDEEDGEDEEDDGLDGGDDVLLGTAGGGINGEGDHDEIELGRWVEQNPLQVQPTMPLEVVMDLFKKMGPRVILVTYLGKLTGLVTVKDLLKVIATQERAEHLAHEAARETVGLRTVSTAFMPLPGGMGMSRSPSSSGSRAGTTTGGVSMETLGDFGGELEILLRDAWLWTKTRTDQLASRIWPSRYATNANGRSNSAGYAMQMRQSPSADLSASTQFVVEEASDEEDDQITPRISTRPLE